MDAHLAKVREEVDSLQTDEQKKLDRERDIVMQRIRDQVSLTKPFRIMHFAVAVKDLKPGMTIIHSGLIIFFYEIMFYHHFSSLAFHVMPSALILIYN